MSSVTGVNDTNYEPFLGAVGGQLAIVDFTGLNNQMKADGLQPGAVKNLRVSVSDTSATGISIYDINLVK